jgi:hypothetical protein
MTTGNDDVDEDDMTGERGRDDDPTAGASDIGGRAGSPDDDEDDTSGTGR